jgi:FAD/FMN-containing dehydrogenase
VHVPEPERPVAPERVDLHRRVKELFDPTNRLNPGRLVA